MWLLAEGFPIDIPSQPQSVHTLTLAEHVTERSRLAQLVSHSVDPALTFDAEFNSALPQSTSALSQLVA